MTLSEDPGVTLLFNVPGNEPAKHMPREMGRKPGESGDSEAKKREPTNEQLTLSKAAEKLKKKCFNTSWALLGGNAENAKMSVD